MFERVNSICLSIIVLTVLSAVLVPRSASAQTCPYGRSSRTGKCYACPVFDGDDGPNTITVGGPGPGGSGCGNCNEGPEGLLLPGEPPTLSRGGDWVIDVQDLSPGQDLQPGDMMTVMLTRAFPDQAANLVEPLIRDGQPAMYMVEIGADGDTVFDFGTIGENAVGGTYTALAVPNEVDSLQAFWAALPPDTSSSLQFSVADFVALDNAAAAIGDTGRRIDIPLTFDPGMTPDTNVEFRWKKEGQPLPQADNPLQAGIYNTILSSEDQSIMGVYAPLEFVVENFLPGLEGQFPLAPYFTPGEYQIEVLVNGNLESTETLVVP